MEFFQYKAGQAYCENVPLASIAAKMDTPVYVYSRAALREQLTALKDAFADYPTLPCFAVKANGNLSILREVFSHGFGADLVSGGELARALQAGVRANSVMFSGVGKKPDEILAGIKAGIKSFHVESAFEIDQIQEVAAGLGVHAPISLRVNPNIDAKTNPKIATGLFSSKFGIVEAEIAPLLDKITHSPNLKLVGIGCHIGSQITSLGPIEEAARRMASLAKDLMGQGHKLEFIDMGGGLAIRYKDETTPDLAAYAQTICQHVKATGLQLVIEPGRVLVGNAGILLCGVIGVKQTPQKKFLIVDGAMNDLMRPSLYDAYHGIETVKEAQEGDELTSFDVAGPICESSDIFGVDRELAASTDRGDLLYLRSCGAYAASMASNYNSRPRAAEVLVDDDQYFVIKQREKISQLWQDELVELSE